MPLIPPRSVPPIIIPRPQPRWSPRARIPPRVIRAPTPAAAPIHRVHIRRRVPVPVVCRVETAIPPRHCQIARRADDHLDAARLAIGVTIPHQVKRVAADGRVPRLAHQPVRAVFVHIIAVAERGGAARDASKRIIVERRREAVFKPKQTLLGLWLHFFQRVNQH